MSDILDGLCAMLESGADEAGTVSLAIAEIDRIRGQVAKLSKIRQIASNAIYFDDNSDYGSALCDICRKCGMTDDEIGREYIEDASLAATEDGPNKPGEPRSPAGEQHG